jgi:nucleoside 2-deoxyribosyltransferase
MADELSSPASPEPGARQKKCFVAMPITTPASYADDLRDADHFAHVLTHLFTPALEQAGYVVIPPKMLGTALIHAEIIRHLEQADLVLADLSNHNPNVFFELGIRTSLDRPVVLVKDARTAMVPFDLGTINVLTYDESLATWTLNEEIKRLTEHISNVVADNSTGNVMWRYFGLTKRRRPGRSGKS